MTENDEDQASKNEAEAESETEAAKPNAEAEASTPKAPAPVAGKSAANGRALKPMLISLLVVAVIGGFLLFQGIRTLGIWDPYELTLADIGCHKAATSGAFDLEKCGLDPSAKHTDVRPLVMVQSVAWGFRMFGVSEAAGRIPLALWVLVGAIVVALAVGRLVDARAGMFSGVVLVTMPMYVVQGRLILGDAATMGAFAIALAGLSVAAFDRKDGGSPTGWVERLPWALVGALGLAAGIGCRGLVVGCVPAVAVGLAWLAREANTGGDEAPDPDEQDADKRKKMAAEGDAALRSGIGIALAGAVVTLAGYLLASKIASETGRAAPYVVATGAIAVGLRRVALGLALREGRRPKLELKPIHLLALVAVAAIALGIRLSPLQVSNASIDRWTSRSLVAVALVGGALLAALRGTKEERVERGIVGAVLALGVFGLALGISAGLGSDEAKFVAAVGATAQTTRKFPTYDLLVRQIAHGLFPWSCFFPFALGRVLARPADVSVGATRREIDLRIAALVAAAVCFAAQTMVTPKFGLMPFAAPVAIAIVIGLCLRDLERAPAGSLAVAIGTAVLVFLVFNDFTFEDLNKTPVELATAPIVEPYGLYGVAVPEELRLKLRVVVGAASLLFLLPIFFVWVDEDPRPGWTPIERLKKPIETLVAAWKHPYQGLLLLLAASFEVCIAVLGVITYKKNLRRMIPQLQALSTQQRDLLVNLWWLLIVGAVGLYVGYCAFLYGRDAFRKLGRMRVATIAIGGLVAAGIWSFGIMPAVANQFSPKGVFSTYRALGAGQPIALLGVNARTAAYDLDNTKPLVLSDPRSAYEWLKKDEGARKWLALRSEHLPEMNKLWRETSNPRTNLPIIDGRSAQVLLASSALDGHANENPLERMIWSEPPSATTDCDKNICAPSHALDCDIDGKLRCVGWELYDDKGNALKEVGSGQKVHLRLVYRVTNKVSGGWQIFIHVEQPGTATARKTWDHVPLQSKYPMDDWLPGDVIVDDSEFNLEPNMRSGAPILILTGFFTGNTRMPLVSGPDAGPEQEGLRLVLGTVPVH